jgi:hypothetical protein
MPSEPRPPTSVGVPVSESASVGAVSSPALQGAISCAQVADRLPEAAVGNLLLPADEREHVESCLRCQAELVQYRKLLRALRSMRTEVLEPAPGLLTEILAGLEEAGERRALRSLIRGRKAAYLGGIAAATAAGAAGAIVIASRSRRRMPLAG